MEAAGGEGVLATAETLAMVARAVMEALRGLAGLPERREEWCLGLAELEATEANPMARLARTEHRVEVVVGLVASMVPTAQTVVPDPEAAI